MFHRAASITIVLFWLTMTGLLLQKQFHPGDSSLREVPFGHVVKLLFLHRQPSDLNIYSDKLRLGRLEIHPIANIPEGTRVINFDCEMHLALPGAGRERLYWGGTLEMDKTLATRRFELTVTVHNPTTLHSKITVIPGENVAHYEIRTEEETLSSEDYTLNENGARQVLQQLGLDPALLQAVQLQRATPPQIKAQQSSIDYHGQPIDTYMVTMEYNGQTLLEFHVDQLGHILRANTFLGYKLVPNDMVP